MRVNKLAVILLLATSPLADSARAASIILSEYNAVNSTGWLGNPSAPTGDCLFPTGPKGAGCSTAEDTFFGRVQGNGGNWIELSVIADHTDMRNWQLAWEEVGSAKAGTIFLSGNTFWSDMRAGTIITITELTTAQGGLGTDVSFDPCHGDWWVNVNTFDTAYVATTTTNVLGDGPGNFSVGDKDWRLTIKNSTLGVVFGPAGEGSLQYVGTGVSNTEVCRLESDPSASITPSSAYDDGTASTFGSPNSWKDPVTLCRQWQNYGTLRQSLTAPCHICQKIVLNEYNAVATGSFLNGGTAGADVDGGLAADGFFGRVLDNGGDWFELVAVGDHLDMRGWKLIWEETSTGTNGTITLSGDAFWSNIHSGTIITFIEPNTLQGGLDTDLSYNPGAGDVWVNINTFDTVHVANTTSNLPNHVSGEMNVSDANWRLTIKDAASEVIFGPAGEGSIYYYRDQVSNTNVGRLKESPGSSTTPLSNYDDGTTSSTFGAVNHWTICPGTNLIYQSLAGLPDPTCSKPADIDHNGVVNIDDLLAVIASWGPCGGRSCPTDIAPPGGNGAVDIDDLLLVITSWG